MAVGVSDGLFPFPSCSPREIRPLCCSHFGGFRHFGLSVLSLVYISLHLPSFIYANVLCSKTFPGELQHTHLITPDREHIYNRADTTTVQLGEPVSFIGVTYRSIGEGLLGEAE